MLPLPPAPPPLLAAPLLDHLGEIMQVVTALSTASAGMLILAIPMLALMFDVLWLFVRRRSLASS